MKIPPKKGKRCPECPLFEVGIPVFDFVPVIDGPKVALVGEGPGYKEVQERLPMVGPTGSLVQRLCSAAGLEFDAFYRTNCVMCGLPRGAKPTESAMVQAADCCRDTVLDNLDDAGVDVLLCLGAVPTQSLRGLKGIAKYRGTVDWGTRFIYTSTYHPAFLLKQETVRHLADIIFADLIKAVGLATGTVSAFEGQVDILDPFASKGLYVQDLLDEVISGRLPVAIDVETDGIDPLTCNLLTIGLAARVGDRIKAVSIPWPRAYPEYYTQGEGQAFVRWMERLLGDQDQVTVYHNKSYDVLVLERYFDQIKARREDTLLLHHTTFPKCPHDLQSAAAQLLAIEPWKDIYKASEASVFKQIDKLAVWEGEESDEEDEVPDKLLVDLQKTQLSELMYYNAMDAAATLAIYQPLLDEARDLDTLRIYETDRELVDLSMYWTVAGIGVDLDRHAVLVKEKTARLKDLRASLLELSLLPDGSAVRDQVADLAQEMSELQKRSRAFKKEGDLERLADTQETIKAIRAEAKVLRATPTIENFNPNSARHLIEVFKLRKIQPTKVAAKAKDKDGLPLPSTSKNSLWPQRDDEFIDTLFIYRKQAKLYSTYLKNLPYRIGDDTRLHPAWKLHSTPTGRFGTKPAVQNWPRDMKKMLRPAPDCVFVRADYSQIELRIAALLSDEPTWIETFQSGGDLHALMAYEYFPSEFPDLDKQWHAALGDDDAKDRVVPRRAELRKRGKNVTFGDIYLAGPETLYEQIREKMDDVQTKEQHTKLAREIRVMQQRLRDKTPNRLAWAAQQHTTIMRNGCIRTPIWSHPDGEVCGGRMRKYPMASYGVSPNEAANTPIQGMAADIMSKATRLLCQRLEEAGIYRDGAWVVLQVHDELTLEVENRTFKHGRFTLNLPEFVRTLLEECMYLEIEHRSVVTGRVNMMPFPAPAQVVVYKTLKEELDEKA